MPPKRLLSDFQFELMSFNIDIVIFSLYETEAYAAIQIYPSVCSNALHPLSVTQAFINYWSELSAVLARFPLKRTAAEEMRTEETTEMFDWRNWAREKQRALKAHIFISVSSSYLMLSIPHSWLW